MPWPDMADRMLGVAVRTFAHSDTAGGSLVTYAPASGSPYPIRAVFDRSHLAVDPSTGAPVSSTNPILGVQLSQLAAEPRKGDRVIVAGVTWRVHDYQPDGVAGALLELSK